MRATRSWLAPGVVVERRDADQSVHPVLGSQVPVRVPTLDDEGGRREPGLGAGGGLVEFDLGALALGPPLYMRSSISAQSSASVPPATGVDLDRSRRSSYSP